MLLFSTWWFKNQKHFSSSRILTGFFLPSVISEGLVSPRNLLTLFLVFEGSDHSLLSFVECVKRSQQCYLTTLMCLCVCFCCLGVQTALAPARCDHVSCPARKTASWPLSATGHRVLLLVTQVKWKNESPAMKGDTADVNCLIETTEKGNRGY